MLTPHGPSLPYRFTARNAEACRGIGSNRPITFRLFGESRI
jgi:hypothetical protein